MTIRVRPALTETERDLAFQCHHDWFAEAGYISPQADGRFTDDFTARSVYFLAYETDDETDTGLVSKEQIIGVVRAVGQGPFRTLTEFEISPEYQDYDFEAAQTIEASALCWRNHCALMAIPHLYRALCQYGLENGCGALICNLDQRVVRITQRMGFPIQVIGSTQYYMGSHKMPVLFTYSDWITYLDQRSDDPIAQVLQMPMDAPMPVM